MHYKTNKVLPCVGIFLLFLSWQWLETLDNWTLLKCKSSISYIFTFFFLTMQLLKLRIMFISSCMCILYNTWSAGEVPHLKRNFDNLITSLQDDLMLATVHQSIREVFETIIPNFLPKQQDFWVLWRIFNVLTSNFIITICFLNLFWGDSLTIWTWPFHSELFEYLFRNPSNR